MTCGQVNIGDISGGSTSLSVTGGLSSASKTIENGGKSVVTVNFPSQGGLDYVALISFQGMGTRDNDNDFEEPIIVTRSATSIGVYLHETGSVTQNLRMHVMIMKY